MLVFSISNSFYTFAEIYKPSDFNYNECLSNHRTSIGQSSQNSTNSTSTSTYFCLEDNLFYKNVFIKNDDYRDHLLMSNKINYDSMNKKLINVLQYSTLNTSIYELKEENYFNSLSQFSNLKIGFYNIDLNAIVVIDIFFISQDFDYYHLYSNISLLHIGKSISSFFILSIVFTVFLLILQILKMINFDKNKEKDNIPYNERLNFFQEIVVYVKNNIRFGGVEDILSK